MQLVRRHLPHLHIVGQPIFITFRLHDSLPPGRHFDRESMTSGQAFVCMDQLLHHHRGGPRYLSIPAIAELVSRAIERGGQTAYLAHSWVIMPNHVHMLITPKTGLSKIMNQLKGATAREANQVLNRTGVPFWDNESFDRLVRDPEELHRIECYIQRNPVNAGLVRTPEEYVWSSSSRSGLKPVAG